MGLSLLQKIRYSLLLRSDNTGFIHTLRVFPEKADHNITKNEVEKALKKLTVRKAPGLDVVAIEYLKMGRKVYSEWLFRIFNVCLNTRRFLMDYKREKIHRRVGRIEV